jgi:signal transduction histidine kinase
MENKVLLSDATYIRIALTNLVKNAIQAMPSGGNLIVEALVKQKNAIISVKDFGGGIPKEVMANLLRLYSLVNRRVKV